jgi:hypothetical protein
MDRAPVNLSSGASIDLFFCENTPEMAEMAWQKKDGCSPCDPWLVICMVMLLRSFIFLRPCFGVPPEVVVI